MNPRLVISLHSPANGIETTFDVFSDRIQHPVVAAFILKCTTLQVESAIFVFAKIDDVIDIEIYDELRIVRDEDNLPGTCDITKVLEDNIFNGLWSTM